MKLELFENKRINEKIYSYEHSSGLKAFIMPKKGYTKQFANFATHYGSINNAFKLPGSNDVERVPDGIAHFLEHKLFDQKDGSVMDKYTILGASPNAYTSFNITNYLFSCTDKFTENFKLLLNFVQSPYLTDESVEKEKGIIGQEIRMYQDDPGWRVFFNYLSALFVNHPVKVDIAGTIESISGINKEVLYRCHSAFYHPSNMAVFVVGDVNPEEVAGIVENSIRSTSKMEEIQRIFPEEPCNINKQLVEQNLAVSLPLFQCGFKDCTKDLTGNAAQKRELTVKIILGMLLGKSSDIFTSLYEEGLINSSFESDYTLEEDYAYSVFGGESKDPVRVREKIMGEIGRLHKNGLDAAVFERTRKAHMGRFIRQFNSLERLSGIFLNNYFRGADFLDLLEVYDNITLSYAQEVFENHFKEERMALSVIHPS